MTKFRGSVKLASQLIELVAEKGLGPVFRSATRWTSTTALVKRYSELRPYIAKFVEVTNLLLTPVENSDVV